MKLISITLLALGLSIIGCKSRTNDSSSKSHGGAPVIERDKTEVSNIGSELKSFSKSADSPTVLGQLYVRTIVIQGLLQRQMDPDKRYDDPNAPRYEEASLRSTISALSSAIGELKQVNKEITRDGVDTLDASTIDDIRYVGNKILSRLEDWVLLEGEPEIPEARYVSITSCITYETLTQLHNNKVLIERPTENQKTKFCRQFAPLLNVIVGDDPKIREFFQKPTPHLDVPLQVFVAGETKYIGGGSIDIKLDFTKEELRQELTRAEVLVAPLYTMNGSVKRLQATEEPIDSVWGTLLTEEGSAKHFPNNIELSFNFLRGSHDCYINFHIQGSGNTNRDNMYLFQTGNHHYTLYRVNNGNFHNVKSTRPGGSASGRLTLRRENHQITAFLNGNEVLSATDSFHSGGRISFNLNDSGCIEISKIEVKGIE
jgi:hypothetical protein